MFGGEFPSPRDFQELTLEALREGIRLGHRRQCVMAPTGGGKTYIGMRLIKKTTDNQRRALFACDRITLINQTSETAERYGLWNHGIIQANNPRLDLARPFQIGSLQTMQSRGWPQDLDLVIVDECHSMMKTWVDYVTQEYTSCPRCNSGLVVDPGRPEFPRCESAVCGWKAPVIVGLSATPFSKGLGKVFTRLVNAATMHELTELGILVPMRLFSCRKPDMTGAATVGGAGGEWTAEAAGERELAIVGDVVTEWTRHAFNLKTIIFGATIVHCEELCKQFLACGVQAACFTSNTTDEERAVLLEEYRRHDSSLRVLISVEALAKGFDVPDVECVCDCRPLRKSLSTAIQMWGRGLRESKETGKTECRLLDFSGNIIRFMADYERIFFEGLDKLDDGEKLDKEVRKDEEHEPRPCPKCGYTPFAKKCMRCGHEVKPVCLVESLPGHMEEVILCGKKKLANDKMDLWTQVATYARQRAKPGGNPAGRAAHLFKDITGEWPPRGCKFETTPTVEPTRNTLDKIRSLSIAFAHRRAS
jgi:superfamily II DNA or RNA helicase